MLKINNKTSGQTYLGGILFLFLMSVILVALSAWPIEKDIYFKKKPINFFGESIQLNIKNKASGQTYLGGVLFILSIFIVVLLSWFIGKDIYYKKTPINNQQTIITGKYPKVNLNSTSFPIAVSLVDSHGYFLDDPRFLQVKFVYYEYATLEDGTFDLTNKSNIEIAKCKYEDFSNIDQQFFDSAKLNMFLCPQKAIDLYGYWSEYSLAYLSIQVSACDYDKHPKSCATKEEIDNYIAENSVNVNLGLLDYVISFDNYKKPITPFFSTPYKFLTNQFKISSIMIQENEIITDGGLVFEDRSSINYLKSFTLFDDAALFNPIRKEYANIDFYSSNQKTVIYRRYIKIPDIVAFVGGILKVVNMVFFYVNLKFSQITKFCQITENLLEFRIVKNLSIADRLSLEKNDLKIKNSKLNSIRRQKKIESQKPVTNIKLAENTKKLKLTLLDYLQIIFKRKSKYSPNAKIYEKAEMMIKHYFDILVIIRFFHEFEYFKSKILANEHLQELSMYKPSVNFIQHQNIVHQSSLKILTGNSSINFNNI